MRGTVDFEVAKSSALASLADWLPGYAQGERRGKELIVRSPLRDDREPGSFSINFDTGNWNDFATNEGGDILELYVRVRGTDRTTAAKALTGTRGTTGAPAETSRKPRKQPDQAPTACDPLPENDPPTMAGYSARWDYSGNGIAFRVYRFDDQAGKRFSVWHFAGGTWVAKKPAKPTGGFPLYSLRAVKDAHRLVVIVEGEKAADSAQKALGPAGVATTWQGGANQVKSTDFSPLAGRRVVIWPDNDKPGKDAMDHVQSVLLAHGCEVHRVMPASGWPKGADAADFDTDQAADIIGKAAPVQAPTEEEAGQKEEPEKHELQAVDLSDLANADIPPPAFIDDKKLLPKSQPTLCGGHGGVGKTYVALAMLCHAAVGETWAGISFGKSRCVFVSLEEPPDILKYRLRRIVEEFNLSWADIAQNFRLFDGTDADSTELAEYDRGKGSVTKLYDEVRKACSGADFIVIDNASDAFGGDEIRKREVRYFIRKLGLIAKENQAAVLLLAHIDKSSAKSGSQGESYSGNTAWHNSVKSRIAILKDTKTGEISMVHEKTNYGQPMEGRIIIQFVNGVPTGSGETGSNAYSGILQARIEDKILKAMQEAIDTGESVHAERKGPCNFYTTLKNYGLDESKPDVYQALTRLLSAGRVKIESYTNKQRKTGKRVVLTHTEEADQEEG